MSGGLDMWHIPWSEGGRKGGRKVFIFCSSWRDRRGRITGWGSHRFIFYHDRKNSYEKVTRRAEVVDLM